MVDDQNHDRPVNLELEIARLRRAVDELSILNDIATAISSTSSLEKIMELIVQKCIKHMKIEQGSVTLLDSKEEETPQHTIIRESDQSGEILPYRLNTHLTGWLLKHKQPLLINDVKTNEIFQTLFEEGHPVRSLLSVPLLLKGKMIGSINVFNKKSSEDFTDGDKRLLMIIATQSAQVIENARLYEEEKALRDIQDEMEMAYNIQMNLLPKEPPDIPGYDIAGRSIPAKSVGGDYFDFIPLDSHHIAFCLGDVSGKGMPAALLMANLQATLRSQSLQKLHAKDCIVRSNALMYRSTELNKFATLFYGVLDTKKHKICYCNAGHNYPLLFKESEEIARLSKGGLVLGAVEDFCYSEGKVPFDRSDLLVIFSDGITEAINEEGTEFGEDRLFDVIDENREVKAEVLIDRIIESVNDYTGHAAQADDMTLVVIKRTK
jgi:serine phosphatase RsbU (regulator of sigma subunit)